MRTSKILLSMIAVLLSVYSFAGDLISVTDYSGRGKRIVDIHSWSGYNSSDENPFKLLIGEGAIQNNGANKWCDTSGGADSWSWVIFELIDIYAIDKIVWRDGDYRENIDENSNEYKISVSAAGTGDGDWTEIVNRTGVKSENTKTDEFSPVEARYVKFEVKKTGSAVRIYGFDIYGTFSRAINDRGNNISFGKSIVDFNTTTTNYGETPANLLNGNADRPWAFQRSSEDRWIVIDLEAEYDVTGFMIDETDDYISGYSVYASKGDKWTKIVDRKTFDPANQARKTVTLTDAVQCRYIKLEIPSDLQPPTDGHWVRMKEFEVYGALSNPATNYGSIIDEAVILNYSNPEIGEGESASKILDGNMNSYWASDKNTHGDMWAEIDLGAEYNVTKCIVFEGMDYMKGYKVSLKKALEDNWTGVISGNIGCYYETNEKKESVLETPMTARYAKIEIPTDWQNQWVRLKEFQIYGIADEGNPTQINTSREINDLIINSISNGIEIITVQPQLVNIHSVDGRLVCSVDIKEGYNLIEGLVQGIYLINKNKVVVK